MYIVQLPIEGEDKLNISDIKSTSFNKKFNSSDKWLRSVFEASDGKFTSSND